MNSAESSQERPALTQEAAQDRLREIVKSCNFKGWDSYDAEPVLVETYALALALMKAVLVAIPNPAIGPTNDGGIVFEAEGDGGSYEVEVTFIPDEPGRNQEQP